MNTDETTDQSQPHENEVRPGELLEWTSHPMRKRPLAAVLVSIFILLVSFVVFSISSSAWFGLLALVVLFASLTKFYYPTRFRLTDEDVTIKTTMQTITKPWTQFRSCYPDRNGILLSPFPEPSRLENFRGIYLIFSGNNDAVTSFVRKQIGSHRTNQQENPQ